MYASTVVLVPSYAKTHKNETLPTLQTSLTAAKSTHFQSVSSYFVTAIKNLLISPLVLQLKHGFSYSKY
jgi:hypothetical protein